MTAPDRGGKAVSGRTVTCVVPRNAASARAVGMVAGAVVLDGGGRAPLGTRTADASPRASGGSRAGSTGTIRGGVRCRTDAAPNGLPSNGS